MVGPSGLSSGTHGYLPASSPGRHPARPRAPVSPVPKITRDTPGPRTQLTPFIPWQACKTGPWKPPGPLYDNLHNRNSPPGPTRLFWD